MKHIYEGWNIQQKVVISKLLDFCSKPQNVGKIEISKNVMDYSGGFENYIDSLWSLLESQLQYLIDLFNGRLGSKDANVNFAGYKKIKGNERYEFHLRGKYKVVFTKTENKKKEPIIVLLWIGHSSEIVPIMNDKMKLPATLS